MFNSRFPGYILPFAFPNYTISYLPRGNICQPNINGSTR